MNKTGFDNKLLLFEKIFNGLGIKASLDMAIEIGKKYNVIMLYFSTFLCYVITLMANCNG